jgi:hypothetical protein
MSLYYVILNSTRISMEFLPMISVAFCYGMVVHPPYMYEPESPMPDIVGPPIVPDELVEAWYPKIRFAPDGYALDSGSPYRLWFDPPA